MYRDWRGWWESYLLRVVSAAVRPGTNCFRFAKNDRQKKKQKKKTNKKTQLQQQQKRWIDNDANISPCNLFGLGSEYLLEAKIFDKGSTSERSKHSPHPSQHKQNSIFTLSWGGGDF